MFNGMFLLDNHTFFSTPFIKDIPVLMISTETGDDIIGEAKSLGAVGAIKKTFTPDKVNEVLTPLL